MDKRKQIQAINLVIKQYFDVHLRENRVPVKDLMPHFVRGGIFPKDHRSGLPIRKVLRDLDGCRELHLIPFAHPERKLKNTNWFFVRRSNNRSGQAKQNRVMTATTPAAKAKKAGREASDEQYVLDICDKILNERSMRQHRFDFLRGDAGTRLPVDAFYPKLNLVIEYRERQHTEPVKHFDKPDIMTVSGVDRAKQRALYDQRRRSVLAAQKIKLIEISYSLFTCDSRKRIVRSSNDRKILEVFVRTQI